jgi:hypothetical protein
MSLLSNFFGGGKNPADAAMPYLNQIPGQTQQYQQPWFDAGKNQLSGLQDQYGQLMNDPGGKMNDIGKSFQQSPGFKWAMDQALQGGNHAAAAGGMAGSPQHEQQNMQMATDMGNQEYNNWMKNALGMYGQGLEGSQGMANQGQQAGQSMSDMIAQTLAQQANLSFNGQQQQNQNKSDMWGNAFKLGGAALGGFAGGPLGAFAGWNAMK